MQKTSFSSLFIFLSATLLFANLRIAQAQVFEASCTPNAGYTLFEGFHYQRCGMPDFDQHRIEGSFDGSFLFAQDVTGLSNDGRMYCVPTSTLNIMAYLADRGADFVKPGPGFSNPNPDRDMYESITEDLFRMGQLMEINIYKGTKGSGWKKGVEEWLASSTDETGGYNLNYFFARGFIAASSTFAGPSPELIAQHGAQGSLILVSVDWMKERVSVVGDHLGFELTGAHMVTGTAAYRGENGHYTIRFNDPADDGINSNQSPFRQLTFATEPVVDLFDTDNGDEDFNPLPGVRYKVIGYGSAFLQSISHITPKFGIFPDPEIPGTLSKIAALDISDLTKNITINSDILRDLEIAPFGALHAALLPDGTIVKINSIDGSITELVKIPGAKKIAYDNLGRILVLSEDELTALDQDGNQLSPRPTPIAAEAIVFDPSGGRIVVFNRAEQQLVFLDNDLLPIGSFQLPDSFLPTDANIPVRMNINTKSGAIALLADGNPRILSISFPAGAILTEQILLGDGSVRPAGLVADESGIFYVLDQDTGLIKAFDENGAAFAGAPFNGIRSTADFRILQSMDIGELPDVDNQLPEDAPSFVRSLQLVSQTNFVIQGQSHSVKFALQDTANAQTIANRTLRWQISGANPASGNATTDANGEVLISWPGTNLGQDDLSVFEDLNNDSSPSVLEPAIVVVENTMIADLPVVSAAELRKREGTVGRRCGKYTTFSFKVSLSAPSSAPVSVVVSTIDKTAKSKQPKRDFVAIIDRTVTFQPGETEKLVNVKVEADTHIETDEFFVLQFKDVVNATLATTEVTGTILNDDRKHPKGKYKDKHHHSDKDKGHLHDNYDHSHKDGDTKKEETKDKNGSSSSKKK